jgi:Tat protein translocase TatB subunit
MFGTLGGPELFLIFVVALIVFGPRKLPEIGKSLGKMMAEFRKASNDFRSTIESEVEAEKIRESMRIDLPKVDLAPAPTAAPAEASPATDPTASGYPDTPAAAAEELSGTSGEPAGTPVPDAVSRGEADGAPVEPK